MENVIKFPYCLRMILFLLVIIHAIPAQARLRRNMDRLDSALIESIEENDVEHVQELLNRGASPSALEAHSGASALELAITYSPDSVGALLRHGAQINHADRNGTTPLTAALCSSGRPHLEFVKRLLRAGARVNVRDKNGRTPLIYAADGGRYQYMDPRSPAVVRLLLRYHAKVNVEDKTGMTPLMMAAVHMRPKIVDILLHYGALRDYNDKHARTLLHLVRMSQYIGSNHKAFEKVMRLLKLDP